VDQKANPACPRFYNGGVHVVGHGQEVWGRKSPSGVQGQSPGKGPGQSPPEDEQNMKLVYNF